MKLPTLLFLPVLLLLAAAWRSPALAAELPDSPCFKCHAAQRKAFSEGNIHSPVAEGDCGACHAEHGSTNKLVLTEKVPQLCYNCHDESKGTHVHAPVKEGDCLICHQIHSSPKKKLLTKGVPSLCSECHDDMAKQANVHSPVADGECMECHKGHQSEQDALLSGIYQRDRYVDFSKGAYELCFNCHESKPFEDPDAAEATLFRNGCTNLHFLHVVGKMEGAKYGIERLNKKRISCNGCHLVHGSSQEKLVRTSLDRDRMKVYSIDFKRVEGGGSCVVGCHKPKEYRQAVVPESVSQNVAGGTGKCPPPKKAAN